MDQKMIAEFKNWFEQFLGVLIAFSGEIDSTLGLFLSSKYLGKINVIDVISHRDNLKPSDYQLALDFTQKNDIILETAYTSELSDLNDNTHLYNRCYFLNLICT
jgi:PP-loop superfamily ATP-utilizing enzyme